MDVLRSSYFYNTLLFLLLSCLGFFLWHNSSSPPLKTSQMTNNYDAFATQVTSIKFSKEGKKRYELQSPELRHYKNNNETYILSPKLYLYNATQDRWLVTAEYALATQGKKTISFIDNVDISGAETYHHTTTQLITDKLTYLPELNTANTLDPVTIVQKGSILHAIGMNVAFNTGTITLSSSIHGSYDPNQA